MTPVLYVSEQEFAKARFGGKVYALIEAIEHRIKASISKAELNKLSNDKLRDLGINPWDIDAVVSKTVYGK